MVAYHMLHATSNVTAYTQGQREQCYTKENLWPHLTPPIYDNHMQLTIFAAAYTQQQYQRLPLSYQSS